MNILHHKSWHVYNKANIERVRKDEAEAEAEAKKKQDRVILAESESRLQLLRKRADVNLPSIQKEDNQNRMIEHVNLFQDLQNQERLANNEEHEAEQKAKDEKWEKQITMYLDKGVKKEDDPWYVKVDRKEEKYIDHHVFKRRTNDDNPHKRKRESVKINEDPLEYITKSLKNREEKRHKRDHKHRSSSSYSSSKKDRHSSSSSRHREHKDKDKSSAPTIQELREKRLERERNEQMRVKALFLGHNPIQQAEEDRSEMDERNRGYNSQFNRDDTLKAKERYNSNKRH